MDTPDEVTRLALAGDRVRAIKVLRDKTGLSFRDAVRKVDEIAAGRGSVAAPNEERMASVTCPKCGVISPDSAEVCDCGYNLKTRVQESPRTATGQDPSRQAQVDALLRRLPHDGVLSGRKEVKELPNILWHDETVLDIVSGNYNGGNGIVAATDRRVVFVDKGIFYGLKVEDFPLDKISSIQYSTGLVLGELTIYTSGNKAVIKHVPKSRVRDFAEGIRARISTPRPQAVAPSPAPPAPPQVDLTAEIQKLGALKAQGLLTDEEFTAAKKKLLGL